MVSLEYFRTLFRYNAWANAAAFESIDQTPRPPSRCREVMAHILGAESLWLDRLTLVTQAMAVWPDYDEVATAEEFSRLKKRWMEYLEGVTEDQLSADISYVNSKGEPWVNQPRDMLMHVVLHSSYHRGQIASLLGRAGETAAYTDFIHGVRQELF